MMLGLIGKKIGMSQIFDDNGKVIPVTIIKAGPCTIVQRKSIDTDGYSSVQLGYEEIPDRKTAKPQQGHFKKYQVANFRYLKEFKILETDEINTGDVLDVELFKVNEIIKVTGISKGKGFQGVVKKHGFAGFIHSHGTHESFRGPGSVGQSSQPSRIFKGHRMPGQMGSDQVTVKSIKIIKIDKENNLVLVKGAIPGSRNSIVYLSK